MSVHIVRRTAPPLQNEAYHRRQKTARAKPHGAAPTGMTNHTDTQVVPGYMLKGDDVHERRYIPIYTDTAIK